jgi:chromosome partitioning protein
MKTIVFANHKGGCGKTTTAFNLAVVLAAEGASVLAVDLDQQGNLSVAFGADLAELEQTGRTTLRLMLDRQGTYDAYAMNVRPRLDVIPCCLDYDAESIIEGTHLGRDLLLKKQLDRAQSRYDYCIIDTPPALRPPTLNALATADLVIIPIESSLFALVGLTQLLYMIGRAADEYQPGMVIAALSTMYVETQKADRHIRSQVLGRFKENVFQTCIPRSTSIAQGILECRSVYEKNPASAAAYAFHQFAQEVKETLHGEAEGTRDLERQY